MDNVKFPGYGSSDLAARPDVNQFQVPPIQPKEGIEQFLGRVLQQDSLPKQNVRGAWNKTKSEREKLMKQLNKANQAIEFVSKREVNTFRNTGSLKVESSRV